VRTEGRLDRARLEAFMGAVRAAVQPFSSGDPPR